MTGRGIADKRGAILRAAVRLFGEGQYHGTSIPTLARAAGVAEGTIYIYFASKEDLAYTALAETSGAIERELVNSVPQQADPLRQLGYAATFLLQVAEENIEAARYVLCVEHERYLGKRTAEAMALPSLLEFVMANAVSRGETKILPPDVLVQLWLGVVRAGILARANGLLSRPLTDLAEQIALAAVDAIAAPAVTEAAPPV